MENSKNIRTLITIPAELKDEITKAAKSEHRSFTNFVYVVLSDYIKNRKDYSEASGN